MTKKAALSGSCGDEAVLIVLSDLVGALGDGRAYHSADILGLGAEPRHGLDRGLDDAGQRPAPAGMGGADDVRGRIAKQHGRAIRREDADGEARNVGDDGIGLGRLCP